MKNIGENIKNARRAKGMTQSELADALGYTKSFLSLVESGYRALSTVDLSRTASALDVNLSDLQSGVSVVSVHFRTAEDVSEVDQKKLENDFLKFARDLNN